MPCNFCEILILVPGHPPANEVVVIGGGNVAIDAARAAKRLGTHKITVVYRRSRDEMPAYAEEIMGAIEEGIEFSYLTTPVSIPD